MQLTIEQLACFARTFAMALKLVHRCRLSKKIYKKNTVFHSVETCRLRGSNIITRSPFYITGGVKSEWLICQACRERLRKKTTFFFYYCFFFFYCFWIGWCTGDQIIELKHVYLPLINNITRLWKMWLRFGNAKLLGGYKGIAKKWWDAKSF